jgi:hypothetical protein
MELGAGLLTEPDEAIGGEVVVTGSGGAVGRPMKRDEEQANWKTTVSWEALRCSYEQMKMTASSRDAGCYKATSVHRGSPSPVMYS